MSKILIIEDEIDIAELVALHLRREGFEPLLAHDGIAGLNLARTEAPALILLDLMLPGMDGVRLFKELRRFPATRKTPVIMLTARAQTADRIAGLELGADDYVTKPFSPKELLLRIKVALKRAEASAEAAEAVAAGPFRFDLPALVCYLDNQPLELTLTEYKLLLFLCERVGRPCERIELLRAVWGYSDAAHSRTLDTHVKRLRAKLGPHAECIATERNVGYVLRVPPP
jgi:two-component system phosphate regulon response regulator PhoB